MKIIHISTADTGGAGNATNRLHQGLLSLGVESYLLCKHKGTTVQNVIQVSEPLNHPIAQVNAERLARYERNYLCFTFATSDYTNLWNHPLVKSADVIHLHWVGDFLDWPSFFKNTSKPIIWTFHDKNPILGGQHLVMDRERLKSAPISELENSIDSVKDLLIQFHPNLYIVTPSKFLGQFSRNSKRFSSYPHFHIFNAIDTQVFKPYPADIVRNQLGIPLSTPLMMFLSNDFHQSHKGLDIVVEALLGLKQPFHLLTVGPSNQNLGIPNHTHVGPTNNQNTLAQLYSAADAFLLPSREDNLPNVMLEALACGTPVIATPVGGMLDVIENSYNGYLSSAVDADSFRKAIEQFLNQPNSISRFKVREYAVNEFSLASQSQKYKILYQKVLTQPTFTVATSIAPKGLELQREAIDSWRALGFSVLSFNNTHEVALLQPQFPEVRFISVSRDGMQRAGKPLVYVQDILNWFRNNTDIRYGGFINSDILVKPADSKAFVELLQREIAGSLIFSRRIEVESLQKLDGKWNRTGIDLWLWDREILHCYSEPADYMVRFPHWDYYMELMPICHGIPVKQLAIPNAYHQTHDAYYDWVRDAVPFALTTFKLIYPHLHKVPDQDHLLLPTIHYCFKHQPAEIKTQDDLEFLAMFLNTLDKFFLETIDRCSLKLNYTDIPHVPQDNRLPLCHNPEAYHNTKSLPAVVAPTPSWELTLATSLSPFDIQKQLRSVASWLELGCEVVSFNNAQEIRQLENHFPKVRFITVSRDGLQQTGRPLVFIDDILQWFKNSGLSWGGFINADIVLQPSQPQIFKQLIQDQIQDSLLFARRIDIESLETLDTFWSTLKGAWIRSGIDLWLFDCSLLQKYSFQTDYMVGMPHWDYFMCLWPLTIQQKIKEIAVPCIFHPVHEQRYDFANQMKYGMKTYMLLAPHLNKIPVLDQALLKFVDFFARHQPNQTDDEYGAKFYDAFLYALDIFFLETIFSNCKRISYVHVEGAQDDIVPGYNHPLHSFGTLEVLLHKSTSLPQAFAPD